MTEIERRCREEIERRCKEEIEWLRRIGRRYLRFEIYLKRRHFGSPRTEPDPTPTKTILEFFFFLPKTGTPGVRMQRYPNGIRSHEIPGMGTVPILPYRCFLGLRFTLNSAVLARPGLDPTRPVPKPYQNFFFGRKRVRMQQYLGGIHTHEVLGTSTAPILPYRCFLDSRSIWLFK